MKRRKRGRRLCNIHLHHLLHPIVDHLCLYHLLIKEKWKRRSYVAIKWLCRYQKFKQAGKNITFLTYDGTFEATDKVIAFIQQYNTLRGFTPKHVAIAREFSRRGYFLGKIYRLTYSGGGFFIAIKKKKIRKFLKKEGLFY